MSVRAYRRSLTAALAVVLLAAIYALASVGHPGAAAAARGIAASRAGVSTATRVCASPGSSGPTASSVAVAAVPGAGAAAGKAVVTPLALPGQAAPAPATLTRTGLLQIAKVPTAPELSAAQQAGKQGSSAAVRTEPGRGGAVVTATGAMAAGLAAEQVSPGQVSVPCGTPATSFWFAGPGLKTAGSIELYLANAGNQAADAQVQVLADTVGGEPVLGNADNGISVPAHGMVVQSLNGLLAGSGLMAVNVSTTVGQVVAAVRESTSAGKAGLWLPQVQAPSRHLIIPGLPGGSGTPQVYVAVPGNAAAQLKITAVTGRGSYQPTGGTGIDLVADSVTAVSLESLSGVAGAVSVTATVPVIAVLATAGGGPGAAAALAASALPVQQQGVLAASPAGAAGQTQLVLSAPGAAAAVRVSAVPAGSPVSAASGQVVKVAARSSVSYPVAVAKGSKATQVTIVVTPLPGSGPVYGARVTTARGTVTSILPVPSSPVSIALPGVRESVTAAGG